MFTGQLIIDGSNRRLRLEWESRAGIEYAVQFKENAAAPEWDIVMHLEGTGGLLVEELPMDQPTDFYRVVIPSDEEMP
jgi:hypothetical protein